MRFRSIKSSMLALAVFGLCAGMSPTVGAAFKLQVKHAQVGDVKLAYYVRGEGKPLVMINGFISSMTLWDPLLIDELAKSHRLIIFDNRGVGGSTDTKDNLTTIPQMADDAAGLIKVLGLKQPDILGWSMGARIAQQLAIRHPDLINKVVLAAANPGGSHMIPADKDVEEKLNDPNTPAPQKLGLVFPLSAGGAAAAKEIFSRIEMAAKQGTAPSEITVSKQTTERQNRARTTLWSADGSNFDNLKNIKNPVLVTDGREDIIDKPINSVIIAGQIPFAWTAFFDGGHAFLFQHPKRFTQTVNVFLAQD